MKQINFKELDVFTDITRTKSIKADIRKDFADVLYRNSSGIAAHSLALKIYETDGPIEIDDREEEVIREAAERVCIPAVIDGINGQLNEQT